LDPPWILARPPIEPLPGQPTHPTGVGWIPKIKIVDRQGKDAAIFSKQRAVAGENPAARRRLTHGP
jgi:hypothetical protein